MSVQPLLCPKCPKAYKTSAWLQKHLMKDHGEPAGRCEGSDDLKVIARRKNGRPLSKKAKIKVKPRIAPRIRFDVWERYMGERLEADCFCCRSNPITPFSGHNTFHAGHIVPRSSGGLATVDNLLPICRDCNTGMAASHWDDYVEFNNFPIRAHGAGINPAYIEAALLIQEAYRLHIKFKNSNERLSNEATSPTTVGATDYKLSDANEKASNNGLPHYKLARDDSFGCCGKETLCSLM